MKTVWAFVCLHRARLLPLSLCSLLHFSVLQGVTAPSPNSAGVIEQLKSTGLYDSLHAAITAARYGVKTASERDRTAVNPAHGLFSTFTSEGLHLRIKSGDTPDAPVHTTWRLESIGYGAVQTPVPVAQPKTSGQRIELIRNLPRDPQSARGPTQIIEWFQNAPSGLEHGFTLAERPGVNPDNVSLWLVMRVQGDLTAHADAAGQNLVLRDPAGVAVASY